MPNLKKGQTVFLDRWGVRHTNGVVSKSGHNSPEFSAARHDDMVKSVGCKMKLLNRKGCLSDPIELVSLSSTTSSSKQWKKPYHVKNGGVTEVLSHAQLKNVVSKYINETSKIEDNMVGYFNNRADGLH